MADLYASNWSETDGSNNSAAPDGFPEGMAPGGVNDGARSIMGAIKRFVNQIIPKTTAGTTTAYTLSYSIAPTALVDGMSHLVLFNAACGANPTLNVNSLGALPIYRYSGSAWVQITAANTIPANLVARVSYNSSEGSYRITSASNTLGTLNEAKGTTISSAATTDIGAASGNYVVVSGTTTITGLGTIQAGARRIVEFSGALILTHDATALILPGAANITTIAGDIATFVSEGSGNWRCVGYQRTSYSPRGEQIVTYETGAVATGTTAMVLDDSIPQNTEGDEYMTLAITPKSALSTLIIDVLWNGSVNTAIADNLVMALFQDTAADALAAVSWTSNSANYQIPLKLTHKMTSGTTSATTFKVRVGGTVGGVNTVTFNGYGGARMLGGVMASSITIREVI